MAARASLLADGDQAVHPPRHRAAHEQEIALGVDLHDAETDLGEVARTHMAGHPLSFNNPRRIGTRRDRPRLAVARVPVCLRTAAEVMTVHDALEATPLGHATHLHAFALGEDRDRDRSAGCRRLASHRKATDHARCDFEPGTAVTVAI